MTTAVIFTAIVALAFVLGYKAGKHFEHEREEQIICQLICENHKAQQECAQTEGILELYRRAQHD